MIEGDLPFNKSHKPGKLIGKSIFKVFADYPDIFEAVRSALKGEQGSLVIDSGSRLWEWRFFPIQGEKEDLNGVIGVAFDLSIQHELWHQGAITDAAAALRKAQTQEDMPPVIVDQLRKQLRIEQAVLVLGSHPDRTYELKFSWPEVMGGSVHPLLGILTDPDLIDNLDGGDWLDGSDLPGELQTAGLCGWPLIANDQILGVLWVGRREPFSGPESRLVAGIANMAASAVQRAGQHELTRQRLARLAALHSIDKAISGSFNLNLTLHIILDQVVSQLDVDAADIFLVDPVTLETTYAEGKGFQRYKPQADISQGRGDLVWRVLQSRELVAIPDLYKEAPTLLRGRMFALEGFRSYYGIPLIAKGKILGVMEVFHRKPLQVDEEWFDFLRTLGIQAAIAMDNAALVENLRRSNLMLDLAYNTTLEGWVRALDLRDKITGDHTQRVVERTLKLAQAVGIPDGQLVHVRRGTLLHDIGKLAVPDSILNKSGPLDDDEWELMKKHPHYAREILEPIEFLRPALPIPFGHHEKWDGSGYPKGISGNLIPMEARVFAVIDVWDALSSPRPYRKAWPEKKIHQFIHDQSGTHFDPQVVQIWERVFQIEV